MHNYGLITSYLSVYVIPKKCILFSLIRTQNNFPFPLTSLWPSGLLTYVNQICLSIVWANLHSIWLHFLYIVHFFQHPINSNNTFFVTAGPLEVSLGNTLWISILTLNWIALLIWKSTDGLASNKLKNELHNSVFLRDDVPCFVFTASQITDNFKQCKIQRDCCLSVI